MKRLIGLCLVVLLVLSFAACGGGEEAVESRLSDTMIEVEFEGLLLTFSEDISYVALPDRLLLTFPEQESGRIVLYAPEAEPTFSKEFFEQMVDRLSRGMTPTGGVGEFTVNGETAFLQHFDDNFVFVMFQGSAGVYGANFYSTGEFDLFLPYFLDVLDSIEEFTG